MDGLGGALLLIAIIVVVFLICREIVCWYWKVNQAVDLLKDIRDILAARSTEPSGLAGIRSDPTIEPRS